MKFQNPILTFVQRTDKPKAICPFNLSKVGGKQYMPLQRFQSWGHLREDISFTTKKEKTLETGTSLEKHVQTK